MGSIEVYDYKQQKWVPYVPDYDKWYQHFKDMRDGYVQPDHLGRYIVGSGSRNRRLKEEEQSRPVVKLVSPVAQATEIAKAEVERERKKEDGKKRKNTKSVLSISKRTKRNTYDPEDQLAY